MIDDFTAREVEAARYVIRGLSNAEIANKLFITEKTVKFHITAIYQKAGVTTRAQFIVKAFREEITEAEMAAFREFLAE